MLGSVLRGMRASDEEFVGLGLVSGLEVVPVLQMERLVLGAGAEERG